MRSFFLPLLAGLFIIAAGCNRNGSKGNEANRLPPKRTAERVLREIDRSLFVPQLAEMKGEMRVEGGPIGNLKLSATFRTQADSAFWFVVKKFGFEGARGFVTKDSVLLLNRLEREVLHVSSDDIKEKVDLLPFEPTLDNLLAAFGGEPIGQWTGAKVDRLPGRYLMKSPQVDGATLEVVVGQQVLPTRWSYLDGDKYGEVIFGDFKEVEAGKVFPYFRSLTFSEKPGDTTRVALKLASFTTHEALKFPISVPSSYQPME